MSLFDVQDTGASKNYTCMRTNAEPFAEKIRSELECLWDQYEPYADDNFKEKFSRDPDSHFWEMYLTVFLLRLGKNVCPRLNITRALRDNGPDICIKENGRNIWIGATCPTSGRADNLDRVPDPAPYGEVREVPRREIELRITGALYEKRKDFDRYERCGIIQPNDLEIVAISGSHFSQVYIDRFLPAAATAVHPIGERYVEFGESSNEAVVSYADSWQIKRGNKDSIERTSFLETHYSRFSGLIWSTYGLGQITLMPHNIQFVHNFSASYPLPERWASWSREYVVVQFSSDMLKLKEINT